jgi:hypothetical protein
MGDVDIIGKFGGNIKADDATVGESGNIGTVTISAGATGGNIVADGNLTSLVVSAGGSAANVTVGTLTGLTSITGDLTGNITSNVGSIGNITVLADLLNTQAGDLTGAISAATSIGSISVAGDLSGSVTTQNGGIGTVTVNELSGSLSATGTNAVDGTINAVTIADGSTARRSTVAFEPADARATRRASTERRLA